jgi:cytoskeletal protein RodZ
MTSRPEQSLTRPEEFGRRLRELREQAGVSLEEIMTETKISRRILEGLEAGRFRLLPEKVFCRSFVRQYAGIIDADEEALLSELDEAWESFLVASGTFPAPLVPEVPKPVIRWHFWLPIGAAALALLAVTLVIIVGPKETTEMRPDPRRSSTGWPTPAPIPTSEAATRSAGTAPVDSLGTEAQPEPEPEVLELGVAAEPGSECWLQYRDRDGRTGEALLMSGESTSFELAGPVVLTIGNAAALLLTVNGRTYSDLGPVGQVLHLEVSERGLVRLGAGERRE